VRQLIKPFLAGVGGVLTAYLVLTAYNDHVVLWNIARALDAARQQQVKTPPAEGGK